MCHESFFIIIIMFIDCKWVDTRWQWYQYCNVSEVNGKFLDGRLPPLLGFVFAAVLKQKQLG